MIDNPRIFSRSELLGLLVLAVLLVVILPLSLDVFRLNLVAKYLTYAFVAIGLVLCWGYGGILSLGQGVFFGLGGYCMAMFLKLESSSVENTKIQSTPGIPDFMDWNQITQLPFFWKPFHSLSFTIVAILLVPAIFAFIIGAAMFKRRVGGVYFAIITQAVAAILTILIVGQQGYTGGINGITDLRTLKGWDIRTDHAKVILYFVEVACCSAASSSRNSSGIPSSAASWSPCATRRIGCGSPATASPISRSSPSASPRVFAAIGGAMFTLQVGFMSPSFVGIVPSIEMVIYTRGRRPAVDLRRGLRHAARELRQDGVLGSFPELWLFGLGALFIAVVLAFPNGLAGIWRDHVQPRVDRLLSSANPSRQLDADSVANSAPAK